MFRYTTTEKVNKTFFTDKNFFKLHNPSNDQNDRAYTKNKEEISDD